MVPGPRPFWASKDPRPKQARQVERCQAKPSTDREGDSRPKQARPEEDGSRPKQAHSMAGHFGQSQRRSRPLRGPYPGQNVNSKRGASRVPGQKQSQGQADFPNFPTNPDNALLLFKQGNTEFQARNNGPKARRWRQWPLFTHCALALLRRCPACVRRIVLSRARGPEYPGHLDISSETPTPQTGAYY